MVMDLDMSMKPKHQSIHVPNLKDTPTTPKTVMIPISVFHLLGLRFCDSIDNDCDELIDDEDENIQQNSQSKYYADIDDDGFGNAYDFLYRCIQPDNYISDQSDCDDTNPQNNPQAEEYCDEIDNNMQW